MNIKITEVKNKKTKKGKTKKIRISGKGGKTRMEKNIATKGK